MRILAAAFVSLLVLIQYPLWFGKGGWIRAWELEAELAEQRAANDERRLRNAALLAEVKDLKSGVAAVEEIARMRLGMVKPGELFIHISEPEPVEASVGSVAGAGALLPVPPSALAGVQRTTAISAVSTSPVAAAAR